MKSMEYSYTRSAFNSPKAQTTPTQKYQMPVVHSQLKQSKMMEYMHNTMNSLFIPISSITARKNLKTRIQIMPLTKEKVKVKKIKYKVQIEAALSTINSPRHSNSTFKSRNYERSTVPSSNIIKLKSNHYEEFFTMMSFMYNKSKKKSRKIEVLIDQLIIYCRKTKEPQILRQIQYINKIAPLFKQHLIKQIKSQHLKYDLIKICEGQLSKLFFNICFEVYLFKSNKYNLTNLFAVHRDIEYYARRLNMLNLTLLCCMDMGKIYCDFFQFTHSSNEYSKAIKLAVFIGDKYQEQLGIDRLGMCQYYKGDTVSAQFYHSSINRLSKYDICKIQQHYSNEKQIQQLLQQRTKLAGSTYRFGQDFMHANKENTIQFNFDITVKDHDYPNNNYHNFRLHLKDIIKIGSLRKKIPFIKSALRKIDKIGNKRYNGDYFLPKASKFNLKASQQGQEEVLTSHRSFNRNNVRYESLKIEKDCKLIDQMLNFFMQQHRSIIKQSPSERDSF